MCNRLNDDPNTPTDENQPLDLTGEDGRYNAASIQVNTKKLLPIPIAVGYDNFRSDADEDEKGSVITARVGKLADKGGLEG